MSLFARVKVNLETDITAGITSHQAAGLIVLPFPPYVIPVPAPVPNAAMEMPAVQKWPPGMMTGRNMMTLNVRHSKQAIVLAGHDCGPMLTHITLPVLVNVLYPVLSMLSSRRIIFSSFTVKMNKRPVGFTSSMPIPIPMLSCADPLPLPTCFPMTSGKNTVSVGMTWADVGNGVVVFLGEMAKSYLMGKVIGKVMGKPETIEQDIGQRLVGDILDKLVSGLGGEPEGKTLPRLNKMALARLSGFELQSVPVSPAPAGPPPQTQTGGKTGPAEVVSSGHVEPKLEIVDILDARGRSIKRGSQAGVLFDPKRDAVVGGDETRVVCRVQNGRCDLLLRILPSASNKVAQKYYGKQPVMEHTISDVSAGEYHFWWDGRSIIGGNRFILQGDYTVELTATCKECGRSSTVRSSFGVSLPRAYIFEPQNRKWVAHYMDRAMDRLSDGSAFDARGIEGATSAEALEKMKDAAFWFFAGHGSSARALFEAIGKRESWLVTDKSQPVCYPPRGAQELCADIDSLPENALEDVFLAVFLCCLTGWDDKMASSLIKKGVDIVVAFRQLLDFDVYPAWIRGFFGALNSGKSIIESVRKGNDAIRDDEMLKSLNIYGYFRISHQWKVAES